MPRNGERQCAPTEVGQGTNEPHLKPCADVHRRWVTEERKDTILFPATILSARKLIDCIESDNPNFAKVYWVDKAINGAEFVMEKIDKKWPTL
jgi:hypothetical protein